LDIVKKIVPLSENYLPTKKIVPLSETIWCLKLVTGLSFCPRPLRSCRAPEQCTCWTPLS